MSFPTLESGDAIREYSSKNPVRGLSKAALDGEIAHWRRQFKLRKEVEQLRGGDKKSADNVMFFSGLALSCLSVTGILTAPVLIISVQLAGISLIILDRIEKGRTERAKEQAQEPVFLAQERFKELEQEQLIRDAVHRVAEEKCPLVERQDP